MSFLVFDVGCIECGESSTPLGVYATREEADKVANAHTDPKTSWGREEWGGQHYVEVFDLDECFYGKPQVSA